MYSHLWESIEGENLPLMRTMLMEFPNENPTDNTDIFSLDES